MAGRGPALAHRPDRPRHDAEELETSLAAFCRASRLAADEPDDGRARPGPVGAGMQIGGRPYRRAGGLAWMR